MKTLLPLLLLLSLCTAPARAAEPENGGGPEPFTLGPELDAAYDDGIELMYRLEFDAAEDIFRGVIDVSSAHPAGYFAMTALYWWRAAQNFDVRSSSTDYEAEFLRYADETIEVSELMLKSGGRRDHALFFLGSAHGLKGRWFALQHSWWKAYLSGNKGRKLLRKCVELNPSLYDAYLGLGIFDYYADTLPGVLGVAAMIFVRGDKERGLESVRLAMEKGRFFSLEARIFLIDILTRYEKDHKTAIAESRALRAQDPDNAFFWLGEILTLLHAREWDRAFDECMKFLTAHVGTRHPWLSQQLALIYLSAGDAKLALNKPAEAAAWFTQGIETTAYPAKGWVTYCYLRRGQAFDVMGRREDALKDYRAVLERDNFWDSRLYAGRAVKEPQGFPEVYRQITEE
ncbi:MAG: hypothetical protein RQ748_02605 [Elusimicrobiales bacterium]|nr:hypothetical protein [Elusimicrobiales bacterium]